MAKTAEKTTVKKKKKGIVQRMMFGDDNKPDLTPEKTKMSKWAMFKYLFFGRFGTMMALNLLTCIFAVPAVLVIIYFYLNVSVYKGFIPYSANLGIGLPVVVDAARQGAIVAFTYRIYEFAILVPCIAVFALGIAGNLYVMRKLIWEEPTRTVKDFFRGIKKCWLPAIIMGSAFGLTLLLFVFSIGYFDAYGLSLSLQVVSTILASILLVFVSIFTAFFMTQNAAFKMSPKVLIRNSFLFVIGTHLMSVLFIGIGVAPAFLAFIPGITMILAILYVLIGFSFSTLVISLYCHYCYERFLYDKIDRSTAVYSKRPNDIHEEAEKQSSSGNKQKKAPAPYKNPKKRKKSIDEGSSITPLAPTFRREDLERLEKEHEQVLAESEVLDDDLGELDDDGDEPMSETFGAESENANASTDSENNNTDGEKVGK